MTGRTITTVAARLLVLLRKMTTKGVREVSAVTASTLPTQKRSVRAMMKARMALVPKAVRREMGIVREASWAFSAGLAVSNM